MQVTVFSVQENLTPLMAAVDNSNLELMKILISYGANVNCSRVCYKGWVEGVEQHILWYVSLLRMILNHFHCFWISTTNEVLNEAPEDPNEPLKGLNQTHEEIQKTFRNAHKPCHSSWKVFVSLKAPFNAVALPNLPGHQQVQFQGQKRACFQCSNHGQKTPSGDTAEASYGCNCCGVNLCRNSCFLHYHTENSHI